MRRGFLGGRAENPHFLVTITVLRNLVKKAKQGAATVGIQMFWRSKWYHEAIYDGGCRSQELCSHEESSDVKISNPKQLPR